MKTKKIIYKNGILLIIIILFQFSFLNFASAALIFENENMNVNENSYQNEEWTNTQWQYYTIDVFRGQTLFLNITYNGDLDLDLRIYVDENQQKDPNQQTNFANDITHCGLPEIQPSRNSQIRGKSSITESIKYKNENLLKARRVYALVFVYDGVGESTYTIRSNLEMTKITSGFTSCFGINEAIIILIVAMVLTTIGVIYIAKRKRIPKNEREKQKLEKMKLSKTSKKQKKKKKKKSKNISMSSRVSKSKRR